MSVIIINVATHTQDGECHEEVPDSCHDESVNVFKLILTLLDAHC